MHNFKMKLWWIIMFLIGLFRHSESVFHYYLYEPRDWYPEFVQLHYPGRFTSTMTPYINGTEVKIPSTWDTPDYRIEEPHFVPYSASYIEHERPYRNSPAYKTYRYFKGRGYSNQANLMYYMGCYCCTVYRKSHLVGTCAIITSRHLITTATTSMLMLQTYGKEKKLEGILGAWYDTDLDIYNSSMYMSPSRMHVHEHYTYAHEVNVSHPIPAMYDLCIWAATHTFYKSYMFPIAEVMMCGRAGSGTYEYVSTIPRETDVSIVAGFQFIKSYKRVPMPWFRYVVHTKAHLWPCPKSDWQWYHCIMGEYWGRFGFDSGGGMNSAYNDRWRYDGLAGICAFSLKLRSKQTVHYFTVLDCYPVLDFMYESFLGLKPPVWLDDRFENTKWAAPVPWAGEYIYYNYEYGVTTVTDQRQYPFYR